MHLASEAVTLECAALGFTAAAGGVGFSLWKLLSTKDERFELAGHFASKAAALGAVVFAAQMFNLPVMASSSVHFIGGVLLAELLGPAAAILTMSGVLLLQALLLSDGGVVVLGVNISNMAILPAASVVAAHRVLANRSAAITAASILSVVLAVAMIAGEIALGRTGAQLTNWLAFVSAMLTNHLPLLPLEAAVTLGIVAIIKSEKLAERPSWRLTAMTAAAAIIVGLMAAATSSSLPDGYESAAALAQMDWLLGRP